MLATGKRLARTRAVAWTYVVAAIVPPLLLGMTFLEESRTEGWGGIGVAFGYLISGTAGFSLALAGLGLYAASGHDRRYLGASLIAAVPAVLLVLRIALVAVR